MKPKEDARTPTGMSATRLFFAPFWGLSAAAAIVGIGYLATIVFGLWSGDALPTARTQIPALQNPLHSRKLKNPVIYIRCARFDARVMMEARSPFEIEFPLPVELFAVGYGLIDAGIGVIPSHAVIVEIWITLF